MSATEIDRLYGLARAGMDAAHFGGASREESVALDQLRDKALSLVAENERLREALQEAHNLADEAVCGQAIRFSVCSRIRTLAREAIQ